MPDNFFDQFPDYSPSSSSSYFDQFPDYTGDPIYGDWRDHANDWRNSTPLWDDPRMNEPSWFDTQVQKLREYATPENIALSSFGIPSIGAGIARIATGTAPYLSKAVRAGEAAVGAGMAGLGLKQAYDAWNNSSWDDVGGALVNAGLGALGIYSAARPHVPIPEPKPSFEPHGFNVPEPLSIPETRLTQRPLSFGADYPEPRQLNLPLPEPPQPVERSYPTTYPQMDLLHGAGDYFPFDENGQYQMPGPFAWREARPVSPEAIPPTGPGAPSFSPEATRAPVEAPTAQAAPTKLPDVVTLTTFDRADMAALEEMGYVRSQRREPGTNKVQWVHKDYIQESNIALANDENPPEPTVAPAEQVLGKTPQVAEEPTVTPSGEEIGLTPGQEIIVPKGTNIDARYLKNMQDAGYVVAGRTPDGRVIFRPGQGNIQSLHGGIGGPIDPQEIWNNLKKLMGRDPTPEEVARAQEREVMPGEVTGRVAEFPGPYSRPYNPAEHGQPWYWKYESGLLSNWPPTSLESIIKGIPIEDLRAQLGKSTDAKEIDVINNELARRNPGGRTTTGPTPNLPDISLPPAGEWPPGTKLFGTPEPQARSVTEQPGLTGLGPVPLRTEAEQLSARERLAQISQADRTAQVDFRQQDLPFVQKAVAEIKRFLKDDTGSVNHTTLVRWVRRRLREVLGRDPEFQEVVDEAGRISRAASAYDTDPEVIRSTILAIENNNPTAEDRILIAELNRSLQAYESLPPEEITHRTHTRAGFQGSSFFTAEANNHARASHGRELTVSEMRDAYDLFHNGDTISGAVDRAMGVAPGTITNPNSPRHPMNPNYIAPSSIEEYRNAGYAGTESYANRANDRAEVTQNRNLTAQEMMNAYDIFMHPEGGHISLEDSVDRAVRGETAQTFAREAPVEEPQVTFEAYRNAGYEGSRRFTIRANRTANELIGRDLNPDQMIAAYERYTNTDADEAAAVNHALGRETATESEPTPPPDEISDIQDYRNHGYQGSASFAERANAEAQRIFGRNLDPHEMMHVYDSYMGTPADLEEAIREASLAERTNPQQLYRRLSREPNVIDTEVASKTGEASQQQPNLTFADTGQDVPVTGASVRPQREPWRATTAAERVSAGADRVAQLMDDARRLEKEGRIEESRDLRKQAEDIRSMSRGRLTKATEMLANSRLFDSKGEADTAARMRRQADRLFLEEAGQMELKFRQGRGLDLGLTKEEAAAARESVRGGPTNGLQHSFARSTLRGLEPGPPGLTITIDGRPWDPATEPPRDGHYTYIYRNSRGEAIGYASGGRYRGEGDVGTLAADKNAGMLAGRAVQKMLQAARKANMIRPGGSFSQYTYNLLSRLTSEEEGHLDIGAIGEAIGEGFDRFKEAYKRLLSEDEGSLNWKAIKEKTGIGMGRRAKKSMITDPETGQRVEKSNFLREMLEFSSAATTTGDFSWPGRQGMPLLFTRHAFPTIMKGFQSFASDAMFRKIDMELRSKPIMQERFDPATGKVRPSIAKEAGLKYFKPAGETTNMSERHQALASAWLEEGIGKGPLSRAYRNTVGYIPRMTNRMFLTMANAMSVNRFEFLMNKAKDMSTEALTTGSARPGILRQRFTPEEAIAENPYRNLERAKEIADFVNTATGHAPLRVQVLPYQGAEINLERYSKALNTAMFAPGLSFSRMRMLSPATYMMASPFVRKQYMLAAVSAASAWFAFTELAKAAGNAIGQNVAEINNNPTDADFGKVRIGNTRMDPGGGFLQFLSLAGRTILGGKTSSATHQYERFGTGFQATTQGENFENFAVNKFKPVARFAWDLAHASQYRPFHVMDRTAQLVTPLYYQDLMELWKADPSMLPWAIPVAFGVGTQTYGMQPYKQGEGSTESRIIPSQYDWNVTGGGLQDLFGGNSRIPPPGTQPMQGGRPTSRSLRHPLR